VDDIITGVQYLIKTGVANPARLGISGQSHGAWLGPLTITRA
jgi:dipeptidyl aminopeptidase/acylaminoacyl peptidase